MRRETLLAGAAAVVIVATLLFLAFVPGAIALPEEDRPEPRGHTEVRDVLIAPGPVSGGTATLQVDTRLAHRGGTSRNVTLEVRAVDLDSEMIVERTTIDVGNFSKDGERRVVTDLSVPREGGYRIESVLYRDGQRTVVGRKEVRGVGSLTPAYAQTPIDFHEFTGPGAAGIPVIEYSVERVDDSKVNVDVSTYLTNEGDQPSEPLRVVFTARQADSNIVADRTSVQVGTVQAGATVLPSGSITVPDGYDYYLEAMIWKGDTLVTSARSVADLSDQTNLTVEESDRQDGLRVSDFESDRDPDADVGDREPGRTTTTGSTGAGMGVPAAVVAILLIAVIARRYHD